MRHITEEGAALIERWEGLRLQVYLCSANYWTIGIGHMLRGFDKTRDTRTRMAENPYPHGITREQASQIFRQDLSKYEVAVLRLINVPLTDGQFNALVSFTFNLGAGALQRSTLRQKVNREEHEDVPAELMKWVRAGGKIERGLQRRRQAEAAMYKSDIGIPASEMPAKVQAVNWPPPQSEQRGLFGWLLG